MSWAVNAAPPEPIYKTVSGCHWKNFYLGNFQSELASSELCMGALTLEGINLPSMDAMVNRYNITISNLLDQYAHVIEVTVRQCNHRPWFDDESRMTRKERHLEIIVGHCHTTEYGHQLFVSRDGCRTRSHQHPGGQRYLPQRLMSIPPGSLSTCYSARRSQARRLTFRYKSISTFSRRK